MWANTRQHQDKLHCQLLMTLDQEIFAFNCVPCKLDLWKQAIGYYNRKKPMIKKIALIHQWCHWVDPNMFPSDSAKFEPKSEVCSPLTTSGPVWGQSPKLPHKVADPCGGGKNQFWKPLSWAYPTLSVRQSGLSRCQKGLRLPSFFQSVQKIKTRLELESRSEEREKCVFVEEVKATNLFSHILTVW